MDTQHTFFFHQFQADANPNLTSSSKRLPLHEACAGGHEDVVLLLGKFFYHSAKIETHHKNDVNRKNLNKNTLASEWI